MSNEAGEAGPSQRNLQVDLARALRKCTPAQRTWLRKIPDHKWQQWGAAKALGISSHTVWKWKRDPNVISVLELQDVLATEDLGITPARILREYVRIAFADVRQLYDDNGELKNPTLWDDDTAAAVSGVDIQEHTFKNGRDDSETTTTSRKAKLHDKKSALDVLRAFKNLAPNRLELTGKNGAPLEQAAPVVNVIIDGTPQPSAARKTG